MFPNSLDFEQLVKTMNNADFRDQLKSLDTSIHVVEGQNWQYPVSYMRLFLIHTKASHINDFLYPTNGSLRE